VRSPSLTLLLALIPLGCGSRTPLNAPDDVAPAPDAIADLAPTPDAEPPPDATSPPDLPAPEDLPAPIDVSDCREGPVCASPGGPCELARIRCVEGREVCQRVGNQPPGTACPGGSCDGNGMCRMGDQRSCESAAETGCGVVFLVGGNFALGDAMASRATPVQSSIGVGGYVLDAYEVTVARFRRFWEAGRPAPMSLAYPSGAVAWTGAVAEPLGPTADPACNWNAMGRDYHPLNCVDWPTAQAFCAWDGNGLGRLPTEAEWEFAARQHPGVGLSPNRLYPWGMASPVGGCTRAHWARCPGEDGGATRRVGSFANSAGFFDLAGNVWEWTGDLFAVYSDRTCWGGATRENPRCGTNGTGYPSIRGGSWFSVDAPLLSGASRDDAFRPTTRSPIVGFRCARTRTR
jgi:formylglycine-generating enzyme required for sulfatase activity